MMGVVKDAKEVINKEKKHIGKTTDEKSYGLALSGGGIRSAAFGLGVIQALHAGDCLNKIDYMSTVSGGGYIGSALTWFLHKDNKPETMESEFPLGKVGVGDRLEKNENKILNYIRQHCNYLLPGKGIDMVSMAAVVMRSMFISLFVYLSLITIGMYVLLKLNIIGNLDNMNGSGCLIPCLNKINYSIRVAILLSILLLLSYLMFSVFTKMLDYVGGSIKYRWFIFNQRVIGWGWKIVFVLFVLGSLQYVGKLLDSVAQAVAVGGISTIIGAVMGLLRSKREQNPGKKKSGLSQNVQIVIAVSFLLYGLMFIAYTLASYSMTGKCGSKWIYCLIFSVLLFGIVVNLNYVGLYRMYRDRLMEAFLPDKESVDDNQWNPAKKADKTLLEKMCMSPRRPYHLINTNVVLVDSPESRFRGRGGDSFTLSPLFCGSYATGWCETSKYMKSGTRGMTLSTAMAISAAAVNPNSGVGGQGVTRNKLVSTLMSLLNIRTGYWAINPDKQSYLPFPPNFLIPGLKGVFGFGMSEKGISIELTDGGHFENLALYELIRRKVSVIVVSDAGADPDFHFGDLANAVERVRVDFGAKIRFSEKKDGLNDVLPESESKSKGSKDDVFAMKYKLAKQGYAIGNIFYHDHDPKSEQPDGKLFYLKSTLVPGLPPDIYGYKSANPKFPDQPTSDQFFDESQFEAYRELGYQITKKMLKSKDAKKEFDIPD
ncbi:MAG: patatin-like phospholipase family protein [Candidatus Brocadiaceae bacterium]|nr:patatin-like phospholipase family protein [Candidatus Brocadiaceae bacterium]